MIDLESIDHIFLFPGGTDLRKGRHSLALLAMGVLKNPSESKASDTR